MKISKRSLYMGAMALFVGALIHFGILDAEHAAGLVVFGMAFPADAIDVVDLRALADGGLVREDLYKKVFMLHSMADTPFLNLVRSDSCNSDKTEWTFDDVRAAVTNNAAVAGSNPSSYKAATGSRVANRAQIFRGAISVSSTARATANAGNVDQLMYETDKELKGLREDLEATALTAQATVVGDNNATAQKTGGFSAWVVTNDSFGVGGASGGYNTSTHVVDAPTRGVGRALSWALVTAQLLATYNKRANTRYLMTTPDLIMGITTAFTAATIKGATPTATMPATDGVSQIGNGFFSGFITGLGQLVMFVPNRNQPTYSGGGTSSNVATCVDVFLIDPDQVAIAMHEGWNVADLGKTSALSDARDIAGSAIVMPYREDAHAVVRDIKPTTAVTA